MALDEDALTLTLSLWERGNTCLSLWERSAAAG
jgi:hypothetical protein